VLDKFGYYFASGVKTHSKLIARQLGNASFHFNDAAYSSYPTTLEPTESLSELYRKRAQQIRGQYDYVVLMYSGGSDSHAVLDAFIDGECKIDEICTTWDYPSSNQKHSHHNAEATIVVLPRIKQLQEQGLEFKFRTVDLTPLIHMAMTKLGNNFEYYVNHHMSPNNIAKHFMRDDITEWADMIAAGKRVCLVWGTEKPILEVNNNKWYFKFSDRLDNCVGHYTDKPGWFDEMFFWTPDMPEIVVKQGHVVRRFCDNDQFPQPWMYQDKPTDCGYNKYVNKYLTYNALKCVIYPTWKHGIFCNGKSTSMIYSTRDTNFFMGNVHQERFYQIADSYYKQLGDDTPQHKRFTLSPMYSRKYEL
jgi:hypothetical protein